MNHANEISIRVSSPLLFIDDDGPSPDASIADTFQSLTVVKRRSSPGRSKEPVAATLLTPAKTEQPETPRKQQIELTIRGENTTINIQTIAKSASGKYDANQVYEFISDRVHEIFQSPGKEEIERALESVGLKEAGTERLFSKKGTWKLLSRSARASQKRQETDEDRYPSIVMLQDPPEPKPEADAFPKMVMLDGNIDRPKFDFRSQSMLNLPAYNMHMEDIEMHRTLVEKERENLERKREGLEQGRSELLKNKTTLERSKSFLIQDKNIIHEKKQVLLDEKTTQNPRTSERNFFKKEKLCLELEKQLLEDEKKIITQEQDILGQEREIIEKEKSILGGEKTVLAEEKAILGKEKFVLEKQQSFLSEGMCKQEEFRDSHQSEEGFSEIEDVFEEAYHLGQKCRHFHPPRSAPFQPFQPQPYPMYVPVYSLPRPYLSYKPQQSKRLTKSIQTQTIEPPKSPERDLGVPFGLMPSFFPRVLITSVNPGFPHGGEERADNVRNTRISEITEISEQPPGPPPPPPAAALAKPKRKPPKKVVSKVSIPPKPATNQARSLKLPPSDLSLKAKSATSRSETSRNSSATRSEKARNSSATRKDTARNTPATSRTEENCSATSRSEPNHTTSAIYRNEQTRNSSEAEESGIHMTDSATKDDISAVSDETISIEGIHFGYSDDFYSNEAIFPDFPGKGASQQTPPPPPPPTAKSAKKLPLTNIGYEMFEKLTQLSTEHSEQPGVSQEKITGVDKAESEMDDANVAIHVDGGNFELRLGGKITLRVLASSPPPIRSYNQPCKCYEVEGDKTVIRRADLWHSDQHPQQYYQRSAELDQRRCNKNNSYSSHKDITISLPTKNYAGEERSTIHFNVNKKEMDKADIGFGEPHGSSNISLFINGRNPCTCEANVGTDDLQFIAPSKNAKKYPAGSGELSPRTADLLDALRRKLEFAQSEGNIVAYGKATTPRKNEFDGLYFVKQFPTPQPMQCHKKALPVPSSGVTYNMGDRKPRPREYLCEECLATMRLYEDDCHSVQNIVDKFEHMIRSN